jgi:predicted SAM-dependent methyltransferase
MAMAMRALARKILPTKIKASIGRVLHRGHLDRESIARTYLNGRGIEIGALHSPLPVPAGAFVSYVDRMSVSDLRTQYPELAEYNLVQPNIIANGELLETIADSSQDFVIANHFLEHCQNPLLAVTNMFRVLKGTGILYLAIPDKRYTFDIDRPVTGFDHLVRDFEEGPAWSRQQHFEEWTRLVDKVADSEANAHVLALMAKDYSIHYHVWTQREMLELVLALRDDFNLGFDLELFLKNDGECIFVLRKT